MAVDEGASVARKTIQGEGGTPERTGDRFGRRHILFLCLCLLFISISAVALADDMPLRCSNGMVQIGDDEGTVRRKCGEPYQVQRTNPKSQTIRGHEVTLSPIMQWSYNMGSADYIYNLTFKEGKVTDISTAGRGFAK